MLPPCNLKKDDILQPRRKGGNLPFSYCLTQDVKENSFTFGAGAIKKNSDGSSKKCFLKLLPKLGKKELQDPHYADYKDYITAMEKESGFRFSYPYIERVYGCYEASCSLDGGTQDFYVLELEYLEGIKLSDAYHYRHEFVRRFRCGSGEDLSDKELMDKYNLERISSTWEEHILPQLEDGRIDVSFSPDFLKTMFCHMYQLLKAVNYYQTCEGKCFSHRDIKPANIFIRENQKALIFDFDRAHLNGIGTVPYAIFKGTKGYADPLCWQPTGRMFTEEEQLEMDIYSLGLTFFYMIFGIDYISRDAAENYWKEEMEDKVYEIDLSAEQEEISSGGGSKARMVTSYLLSKPEFEGLRNILKKMTARMKDHDKREGQVPEEQQKIYRYENAGQILKDMKKFLTEYYGGADYCRDIMEDPSLLDVDRDRRERKSGEKWISYKVYSSAGTIRGLDNYMVFGNTMEIEQFEVPVMILTCLEDRVEYVLLDPGIEPVQENDGCVIGKHSLFRGKNKDGMEYEFPIECW